MFKHVLDEAKDGAADNDVGRVLIHHPSLDNAIVVPLHSLEEFDAELVMEHVEKVLQSHDELTVTEGFDIGIINVPKESGWRWITDISGGDDSIKKKTSLVQIVNEDSMCMARSVAVLGPRK
ncbi:uncharacterized protein LOC117330982 [Pecten maximus]|uniref:uncharacterized protein LOC117330982 n=1 Tax=Pecten maximus TaxID=6579 RepID=UPI001457F7A5|nr:uncharacterized protein LOC117330982 [Pecten maximus]